MELSTRGVRGTHLLERSFNQVRREHVSVRDKLLRVKVL